MAQQQSTYLAYPRPWIQSEHYKEEKRGEKIGKTGEGSKGPQRVSSYTETVHTGQAYSKTQEKTRAVPEDKGGPQTKSHPSGSVLV